MTRPCAAADFAAIRARLRELRLESTHGPDAEAEALERVRDPDRRFKERREDAPPPWVPTIFFDDGVGR